jgi:hypothetical protein
MQSLSLMGTHGALTGAGLNEWHGRQEGQCAHALADEETAKNEWRLRPAPSVLPAKIPSPGIIRHYHR